MEYRSTGTAGRFNHFGGDLVSNVESSHGVQISGASTGGVIESVGDDSNISLTVRAKGTGGITIGNSSQSVTIGGGQVFKGYNVSTFTAQFAAISSGQVSEVALSTATGLFAQGDLITIDAVVTPAEAIFGGFRTSTDASTRITMLIANPGSTATSTGRVSGRVVWADLT